MTTSEPQFKCNAQLLPNTALTSPTPALTLLLLTNRYMAAGGAATSLPVLQFFEDIGVPIMEGYGLTETSPMISSGEL